MSETQKWTVVLKTPEGFDPKGTSMCRGRIEEVRARFRSSEGELQAGFIKTNQDTFRFEGNDSEILEALNRACFIITPSQSKQGVLEVTPKAELLRQINDTLAANRLTDQSIGPGGLDTHWAHMGYPNAPRNNSGRG